VFNDYMVTHSTYDAPRLHIAFNTAVAVTITALLWLPLAHADDRPSGIPDEAKYVKVDRVTDGDTIVLRDSTRVRLHGIDTPERDQPYGSEATAALENMVKESVYILEVDTDRYGRMVGQLYHSTEGYDINASMVCAGHAFRANAFVSPLNLLHCANLKAPSWRPRSVCTPKDIALQPRLSSIKGAPKTIYPSRRLELSGQPICGFLNTPQGEHVHL
jgi:endonuclease YncB( thermonuclease family)